MEARIVTFKDRSFWSNGKKIDLKTAARFRQYADEKADKILNRVLLKSYLLPPMPQLSFLDKHQRAGVRWILSRNHSYIAHAPGAGKTAQAIVAAALRERRDEGQVLFIVPPTLTTNWIREIQQFVIKLSLDLQQSLKYSMQVVPVTAKKNEMNWGMHYIVCPDSMLTKKWVLEKLLSIKWRFIAVDEASRFKEPDSARTIALFGGRTSDFSSPGIVYRARHCVLLDGSPMPNRPMELWTPTYSLAPECIDFRHYSDFGYHYCAGFQDERGAWNFRGSSNEEELKQKLQKKFMHMVPESALGHPERLRSILWTSEDGRTPKEIQFEQHALTKLKSFDREDKSQGDIATARRRLGVSKVKWVAKYVSERLQSKNESILLFAWHRDVCEELASSLQKFKPGVVIGGTKAADRDRTFQSFKRGRLRLIIGNIAAMGRGHNLQRADRVIFAEYSWSDELNKQCEKRASRRGRDRDLPVRCEYIAVPGSMDEPILQSLLRKERVVKKVIG